MDARGFADEVGRLLELYSRPVTEVQFNLLGSHDTPRFRTMARGDDHAYRLATLFQMTYPGVPSIYYGDEIGLEGPHDPGCRSAFPWDEHHWDQELRKYVQRCITLRQAHPALRRGDLTWLFVGHGVVAYGRRLGSETLLVALNNSHQPVTLSLPVEGYIDDGTVFHDTWDRTTTKVAHGRIEGICIPARSGMVLEAIKTSGEDSQV
jgi:neopullulanase